MIGPVIHNTLPDDKTATIEELCRPISADVITRDHHYFGLASAQQSEAGRVGAMTLRMNSAKRGGQTGRSKPQIKIDHDDVRQLSKDGKTPREIGDKYGVRSGTISRILRKYSDG